MDRFQKKKREEEEQKLAEVLQDFKNTFESTKSSTVAFVRGEVVNADKNYVPTPVVPKQLPTPTVKPVEFQEAVKKAAETAQRLLAQSGSKKVSITLPTAAPLANKISDLSSAPSTVPPPVNRPPKPGKQETKPKVSNLESFMNELKTIQEQRAERKHEKEKQLQASGLSGEELNRMKAVLTNPYLDSNYSEYSENLDTTNLYISYLPLDTTLEDLYDTFGTFGPLASARILYPRQGEYRQYLFAFVAYMCRKDAERALGVMNGCELSGSEIKVNWGKVVEIPSVPFYVPPPLAALALPDGPTGLPFNAKPRQCDVDDFISKYGKLPELNQMMTEHDPRKADYNKMLRNAIVRVVIPTDRPLLRLIHRTIEYVVREGPQFEAAIMAREMKNPIFRFLYENCQPAHVYYRWKLFSILQGDDPYKWRTERFRMFDDGSWWEPPPYSLYDEMPVHLYYTAYKPKIKGEFYKKRHLMEMEKERSQYEAEKAKRRRGALSDDDRDFLEQMLRNLTPKRRHVGLAMCWCLRRAKSAREIVDCICEALMIPETPLYKKLGRFYLLSDILANCEVIGPDIANYRQHIEPKLEAIFKEFNTIMKRIPTRINQAQFRSRISGCIQLWCDNTIYPRQDLIHLQNIFYGIKDAKKRKEPSPCDDDDEMDSRSPERDESHTSENNGKDKPNFKTENEWIQVDPTKEMAMASKWERDDYDYGKEDKYVASSSKNYSPPQKKSSFGGIAIKLGIGSNKDEVGNASGKSSDEKRKILRNIETKVLLFQEELEEMRDPFMQEKVDQYREELLQKADLTAFAESAEANQVNGKRDYESYSRESRFGNKWSDGYRY